jgi:hypothetical protein
LVDYLLHNEPVGSLKGKLRLRQVTRLCDGGHQTNVITSRWDLRDIEVAYRMFERWRQENFFKYRRVVKRDRSHKRVHTVRYTNLHLADSPDCFEREHQSNPLARIATITKPQCGN